MPVEIPAGPRYQLSERPGELSITIPAKRYWFLIPMLGAWLCLWVLGEIAGLGFLIGGLFGFGQGEEGGGALLFAAAFAAVWLTLWTLGGIAAVYTLLWQVAGREVITIDGLVLRIERRVPCWTRVWEYRLEDVRELRMPPVPSLPWPYNAQQVHSWPLGRGAGLLAFDYGAKTIRFGLSLDEAEAKMLLAEIAQRHPSLVAN